MIIMIKKRQHQKIDKVTSVHQSILKSQQIMGIVLELAMRFFIGTYLCVLVYAH